VLSGNRNFEGRVHPDVRANYLASPPLVVAYALAGSMQIDLTTEPLGTGKDGKPVYLKDIWPSTPEIAGVHRKHVTKRDVPDPLRGRLQGRRELAGHPVEGETYEWDMGSTYVQNPPYFENMTKEPEPVTDIVNARVLGVLLDRSRPTTSRRPATSRRPRPPASTCSEHQVRAVDFNQYGTRRGNHEVMMRGTFANIRIKNQMVHAGHRRRLTKHFPSGDGCRSTTRPCATRPRASPGRLRRQGIRHRLVARLGGQGHQSARRPRRDRRELRAHPPLEPGRHGRAAAACSCRAGPGRRSA
jgi:aconitate hydratase